MVRRKSKFAIARFRLYSPYGDELEKYCLTKLLQAIPARRVTLESWITQYQSYMTTCIELAVVEKGEEAMHFLEGRAKQGFSTERLMEIAKRFIDEGWLEDVDIDTLLETVAPQHAAIEKALQEACIEEEEADAELNLNEPSVSLSFLMK